MKPPEPTREDIAALTALANGIIPPDSTDGGAAMVNAGMLSAEKWRKGINAEVYAGGLETAAALACERYGRPVAGLNRDEIHTLLDALRDGARVFFKQLRMDVCGAYMSDPAVWERIGFPGPSTEKGGYPDFDQPQSPAPSRASPL